MNGTSSEATGSASAPRTPARAASRRLTSCAAIAAVAGITSLTGCSGGSLAALRPSTAVTVTVSPAASTTPAAVTTPVAPVSTPAPATPSTSAAPTAVPVLGQLAGDFAHGSGFGQVRPGKLFNGGDPTGLLTKITWSSWGGSTATGTGTSDYVGPSQSVAAGQEESATVVAFNLGDCDGKLMYRSVEWYFPQHGQSFQTGQYEDVCSGSYVPSS